MATSRRAPAVLRRLLAPSILLIVMVALLPATAARSAPTPTMPVDQIRPGQTGYGLTVFEGFKIERFKVRVIGVLENFMPKQDIILVRLDHPRLRQTQLVGGMSGSPIYIDGKLIGAVAYGWRFAKEPIAGVTPIGNMLGLLKNKLRGPQQLARAHRRQQTIDRLAMASLSRRDRWWRPLLPRRAAPGSARTLLVRASVPLVVAGLAPDVLVDVRKAFGRFGFEPLQAGGTGKAEGPARFEPGAAIGLQLARGDVSMAGTGTVTWVDGKDVLGFGHPAFNAGEIYLPAISARIDHTLANTARSFKLSSPARVLGMLVQDRQPAIHADTSGRVDTVPLSLKVRSQGMERAYHVELARHRLLTPSVATMVLSTALSEALSDVDHATYTLRTRIRARGLPLVKLSDDGYSPVGVQRTVLFMSRGLSTMRSLLNNDFRPVELERIDMELDVALGDHAVQIVGLQVSSSVVEPGARVSLTALYRSFGGGEFSKSYPLDIPAALAGSVLNVELASGASVAPTLATPENLKQYVRNLQRRYPARSVVITLYTPDEGLAINGRVIRDLPTSVIDSLNTTFKVREEKAFKEYQRRVIPTQQVVAGKRQIRLRVKSEDKE